MAPGFGRLSRPVVALYALCLSAATVVGPALVLVVDAQPAALGAAVTALVVGYLPVGALAVFESAVDTPG